MLAIRNYQKVFDRIWGELRELTSCYVSLRMRINETSQAQASFEKRLIGLADAQQRNRQEMARLRRDILGNNPSQTVSKNER